MDITKTGYISHFGMFFIPDHMLDSLQNYVEKHIPVGSFLEAVICNNLREAVAQADDDNLKNLPAFVSYLYNKAPASCWGSLESYKNWIKR